MSKGWIGVDLDGTLAIYDGWQGANHIGEPVPLMIERVKDWISQGIEVKIFTARVSSNNPNAEESKRMIEDWCLSNIGRYLPVTAEKDYGMVELWDDRCIQIIPNTGKPVLDYIKELSKDLCKESIREEPEDEMFEETFSLKKLK